MNANAAWKLRFLAGDKRQLSKINFSLHGSSPSKLGELHSINLSSPFLLKDYFIKQRLSYPETMSRTFP
jgi:hypothetical protein